MALQLLLKYGKINKTYCVCLAQKVRLLNSKVPDKPQWKEINPKDLPPVPELTDAMINHIERMSLVEFNNKAGVERLRSAIEYANQLHVVNTEGVEPMYTVLEDRELLLREDGVTEGGDKASILQNAVKVEEDYFVAPPGNIPLKQKNKQFQEEDA